MTTTITTAYRIAQGGASLTALQTAIEGVPVPPEVLSLYGLRVTSDIATIVGTEVVRTIIFNMLPSVAATATPNVDSNGKLQSVTVTAPGANYVRPPVVSFTGSDFGNLPNSAPKAHAGLKIVGAAVAAAGSGYSAATVAKLVGGVPANDPNFVPAALTLTIVGGHITGVAIANAGSGYTSVPTVVIVDPAATPGSGGSITLSMGVSDIEVDYKGLGLPPPTVTTPTSLAVVLTPWYKSSFPDTSNQAAPVAMLMTTALSMALSALVTADTPVVA